MSNPERTCRSRPSSKLKAEERAKAVIIWI